MNVPAGIWGVLDQPDQHVPTNKLAPPHFTPVCFALTYQGHPSLDVGGSIRTPGPHNSPVFLLFSNRVPSMSLLNMLRQKEKLDLVQICDV